MSITTLSRCTLYRCIYALVYIHRYCSHTNTSNIRSTDRTADREEGHSPPQTVTAPAGIHR